MTTDKKIILDVSADNLDEFRKAAERAKAAGATHVMVGNMPRSRWMWDVDLTDPYPNWCMGHAQLFKLVCPPQLKEYLPTDFIDQCFNLVKDRCDILNSLGLKGALFSNEPFWLPEEVYLKHPYWRGARCDHPRRSKRTYYSPCIDNPEVLEMYRYAVRELVSKTGIDFITFMSNDSGGGLCWSNGTYIGPNGPESCRTRSMSERILGFMDALDAGARDAGVDITLSFNANIGFKIAEEGVAEAWRGAKDNYIINLRDNKGGYPIDFRHREGKGWIKGIPNLFGFAQSVGSSLTSGREFVTLLLPKTDFEENWSYLQDNYKNAPSNWAGYVSAVRKVAVELAGEDAADLLTDAFYYIGEGELHFSHDGLGLIMYGVIHQRWINRPFVLFPDELKPEDRDYYRRFQFQALDEKHANDLLDMQNIECARGFSAAFLLSETARRATASFNKAIGLLEQLIEKKPALKDKASMLIRRLKIYNCLMKTCSNAALFQDLVDNIDFEAEPPLECRWPTRNEPRIEQFQNITRSEVENAYKLADLLEGYESELFSVTDEANEDIFTFGPNLTAQIRRKAEIMLSRELDVNRVLERHNI